MSTDGIDPRFQMAADVRDAVGRPAKWLVGTEGGEVIVRHPPGEGTRMTPSQCDDAITALMRARDAAAAQVYMRNLRPKP